MDRIMTIIMAALPMLASELVKNSVKDAYEAVKDAIRSRWGDNSAMSKALADLESDPQSEYHQKALAQTINASSAELDADLQRAVDRLAAALNQRGVGGNGLAEVTVSISGGVVQGVVGAQDVHVDTMTFGPTGSGS